MQRTSGILSLCSLSALTLPTMRHMPTMTAPIIAVFVRQFAGCAYQPPAGDQTCFGYLSDSDTLAHGSPLMERGS